MESLAEFGIVHLEGFNGETKSKAIRISASTE